MKRRMYEDLIKWKNSNPRLPLILLGARQVGKTYLLNEFGKSEFFKSFVIDFEKDGTKLQDLFSKDLDPEKIISELSLFVHSDINVETDLLVFDEVQSCPRALTALKYLHEALPSLAICCAGSLLGISLTEEAFPVGSVSYLHLYPMTFAEFVLAAKGEKTLNLLEASFTEELTLIRHEIFWDLLKTYYVVGGMPKAVQVFCSTQANLVQALKTVREVQNNLVLSYMNDINKHSGKLNAMHIARVFENIPRQLSANVDASVKRYRFNGVLPGKRSFVQLEGPIHWLEKSGLILKSHVCNHAEHPLMTFTKDNIFRLYLFDVGILGALLNLDPDVIMNDAYGIKKGYYAENFAACELKASGIENIIGWQESNSEIEFLITSGADIVPVEVKAGHRTKAQSLIHYIKRYHPKTAMIFSARQPKKKKTVYEWPLYFVSLWRDLLKQESRLETRVKTE